MVFGQEAEFYSFDDKFRHKKLGRIQHQISNNHHRGGQSQNRLARLRVEQIHRYLTQLEEGIKKYYTKNGICQISQLILSGPGLKKEQLADRLGGNIGCPIQIFTDLDFESICSRFPELVAREGHQDDEKHNDEILDYIRLLPDRLVFGEDSIRRKLSENQLSKIWVKNRENWPDKKEIGKTDLIVIAGHFLDDYGGCIGLLWTEETVFEE